MRPMLLASLSVLALSACQPDGGGGSSSGSVDVSTMDQDLITGATDWMRGYVSSFNAAAVTAIRATKSFKKQDQLFRLSVTGHPDLATADTYQINAFKAAGIDYALSTGLTGAGETVALIDNGLMDSHELFADRTVTIDGTNESGGHGTGVAGVAAMVAPEADLYMGTLSYTSEVDFGGLASIITRAKSAGAIVLGNSWGMPSTYETTDYNDLLGGSGGQAFVSALQSFAKTGVIVFSSSNTYDQASASALSALPLVYSGLEDNWITVINLLPEYDNDGITSAIRVGSACLEAAQFCLGADGQLYTASTTGDSAYTVASGASYAQPQVAAAVALLAEAFPDLSAAQLRDRLLASADNTWFDKTAVVDFGDGIIHGYNEEFGHGFLDLKAALLPIGSTTVSLASGDEVSISDGEVLIVAGPLVSDAVAEALSAKSVTISDGLSGTFYMPATALVAEQTMPDLTAVRRNMMMASDLAANRAARHAFAFSGKDKVRTALDPAISGLAMSGVTPIVAPLSEDLTFRGVADESAKGFGVTQHWNGSDWSASLGTSSYTERGALMGMTFPGFGQSMETHYSGVDFSVSKRLAEGVALRAYGEIGTVTSTGIEDIASFGTIGYDGFGVGLDLADTFRVGDVLNVAIERPSGIASGSMTMSLPTSSGFYEDVKVDLAPRHRQIDLAVAYEAPVGRNVSLYASARHSWQYGHKKGARNDSILAGIQVKF